MTTLVWIINVSTRTQSSQQLWRGLSMSQLGHNRSSLLLWRGLSMSQLGHNPHYYLGVDYQCLN